jgi:hypothetical protein
MLYTASRFFLKYVFLFVGPSWSRGPKSNHCRASPRKHTMLTCRAWSK